MIASAPSSGESGAKARQAPPAPSHDGSVCVNEAPSTATSRVNSRHCEDVRGSHTALVHGFALLVWL